MKSISTLLLLFCALWLSAQAVVDFEDFNLPDESFLNGSEADGGFATGDVFLNNSYSPDYGGFWSGWAISNTTDVTTPGFMNQYSAYTGSGFEGSEHYAVSYAFSPSVIRLTGDAAGASVSGLYITNSTYVYLNMRDGGAPGKVFGGVSGNDPDFFLLTIQGFSGGELTAESVEFYLADYRFDDNSLDYIVDEWTFVDLTALGAVDSLQFSLTSSDTGDFGMNTPAYFCVDNIFALPPTSTQSVLVQDLFEVFPNPTADYLHIRYGNGTRGWSLAPAERMDCYVFDASGRVVMQRTIETAADQLDMRRLAQGVYTVLLQGEGVYAVERVVRQ